MNTSAIEKVIENKLKTQANANANTNFKIYFTYGKDGSYTRSEKMPYR